MIGVRSMEPAIAWYKEKLDLPASQRVDDGGVELLSRNAETKIILTIGTEEGDPPILDTRNAAKTREWLLARGVEVGPVQTDRQGTHYIEMRDLENNIIEICEEP